MADSSSAGGSASTATEPPSADLPIAAASPSSPSVPSDANSSSSPSPVPSQASPAAATMSETAAILAETLEESPTSRADSPPAAPTVVHDEEKFPDPDDSDDADIQPPARAASPAPAAAAAAFSSDDDELQDPAYPAAEDAAAAAEQGDDDREADGAANDAEDEFMELYESTFVGAMGQALEDRNVDLVRTTLDEIEAKADEFGVDTPEELEGIYLWLSLASDLEIALESGDVESLERVLEAAEDQDLSVPRLEEAQAIVAAQAKEVALKKRLLALFDHGEPTAAELDDRIADLASILEEQTTALRDKTSLASPSASVRSLLDQANDALSALMRRQATLTLLSKAMESRDPDSLASALQQAESLELPEDDLVPARALERELAVKARKRANTRTQLLDAVQTGRSEPIVAALTAARAEKLPEIEISAIEQQLERIEQHEARAMQLSSELQAAADSLERSRLRKAIDTVAAAPSNIRDLVSGLDDAKATLARLQRGETELQGLRADLEPNAYARLSAALHDAMQHDFGDEFVDKVLNEARTQAYCRKLDLAAEMEDVDKIEAQLRDLEPLVGAMTNPSSMDSPIQDARTLIEELRARAEGRRQRDKLVAALQSGLMQRSLERLREALEGVDQLDYELDNIATTLVESARDFLAAEETREAEGVALRVDAAVQVGSKADVAQAVAEVQSIEDLGIRNHELVVAAARRAREFLKREQTQQPAAKPAPLALGGPVPEPEMMLHPLSPTSAPTSVDALAADASDSPDDELDDEAAREAEEALREHEADKARELAAIDAFEAEKIEADTARRQHEAEQHAELAALEQAQLEQLEDAEDVLGAHQSEKQADLLFEARRASVTSPPAGASLLSAPVAVTASAKPDSASSAGARPRSFTREVEISQAASLEAMRRAEAAFEETLASSLSDGAPLLAGGGVADAKYDSPFGAGDDFLAELDAMQAQQATPAPKPAAAAAAPQQQKQSAPRGSPSSGGYVPPGGSASTSTRPSSQASAQKSSARNDSSTASGGGGGGGGAGYQRLEDDKKKDDSGLCGCCIIL